MTYEFGRLEPETKVYQRPIARRRRQRRDDRRNAEYAALDAASSHLSMNAAMERQRLSAWVNGFVYGLVIGMLAVAGLGAVMLGKVN